MKLKILKLLACVALSLVGAQTAMAQPKAAQPIKIALCYDMSKSYTFISPPVATAVRDYAKILNQKGGIEGHPIEVLLQDHGNEPQRGIECYEKMKREGAVTFDFLSTPVSAALLPRLMKDGNVQMSALTGRGDTVDGDVYKWMFPIGPTYWAQMANNIQYIKSKSNNSLKGVKIAYFYLDYVYGQDQLDLLKTLAAREGFELQLFPNPLPGNDQAAAWTQIRRANPDWIISWNLSNMHAVAAREMKRNGIPMEKYISSIFLNEVDLANIGLEAAKGLKRGTYVIGGKDHPLIQQIIKELYNNGKGSDDPKYLDNIYYNTGLAMYSSVFEGARLAIKQYGWPLTPDKMRRGLESLKNYDANGFMAPITVTAKDHGGGGKARVDMWDGAKWIPQTDWISAYNDDIWGIVKKDSAKYLSANPK